MCILTKNIFFLLLAALCQPSFGELQNLQFSHLSTIDGLPNSRVYSILQDTLGYMWFGTLDGLCRYDGYEFINFRNDPEDSSSIPSNRIILIYEDSEQNLWLATKNNGVNKFNPQNGLFVHYRQHYNNPRDIVEDIESIYEDRDGNFIFQANDEYSTFNKNDKFIERFPGIISEHAEMLKLEDYYKDLLYEKYAVKKDDRICWLELESGFVWIGTRYNGLYIYDSTTEQLDHYSRDPIDPKLGIRTIYQDKSGMIWIGTEDNGIYVHNPLARNLDYNNKFLLPDGKLLENITVRAITEDLSGNLWIGTNLNGLIKFNPNTGKVRLYTNEQGNNHSLINDRVISLYTDSLGTIWAGTWGGISIYNPRHDNFNNIGTNYIKDAELDISDSTVLCYNRVYGFCEDHQENVWIANWDALSKYSKKTQKFTHYPAVDLGVDNIRDVFIDSDDLLWISCEFGGLLQLDLRTEMFNRFYPGKSKNNLVNQNVFDTHEDKKGNVWIATFNGLDKYDKKSNTFFHFTTKDGLASNMIYGILEDEDENLWFTTTNGISQYQNENNRFINYNQGNGIAVREFAEGGFHKSSQSGKFIVGGIHGFLIFHPDDIKINTIPPQIHITKLQIMNKDVNTRQTINGRTILTKNISYESDIALKHNDKNISIEFTAFHYTLPGNNQYAYKMEGIDTDWIYCDNRRIITYPNLPVGDYTFIVKASNSDGIWNERGVFLRISMAPPWWRTWWAFTLYFLLGLAVLYIARYIDLKRQQLVHQLEIETVHAKQLEETNQLKSRFFSYISHEFRTPLTMILGPIQEMLAENKDGSEKKKLKMMLRNSKQLIYLINQLLDLSRIESGKIKLQVHHGKINSILKRIVLSLSSLAEEKGITLQFTEKDNDIKCYFDQDKIEKIIYNLLSNALKFTPEGGWVSLTLSRKGKSNIPPQFDSNKFPDGAVAIYLSDSGIGIEQERLPYIFNHFYQVGEDRKTKREGTGLGLAMVKEFVELHSGQIIVESTLGAGSNFNVLLPLGRSHLSDDDIIEAPYQETADVDIIEGDNIPPSLNVPECDDLVSEIANEANANSVSNEKPIVLVVDDNDELRGYIKQNLVADYKVREAGNGASGMKAAFDVIPDLIISDVVMPEMDGFELCRILKTDVKTCHIPIVLLTAKASDASKLEGLEAGAIEYLSKPFNPIELNKRVENLIKFRQQLQSKYRNEILSSPDKIKAQSMDEKFLETVCSTIDKFISESYFTAERLEKEVGMSHTNFNRKLRALTDQSPNQFMRSYKLKRAAQLLEQNFGTVMEIAYQVGFSNPAHFAKCFKNQFGVLPSEYKKKSN